MMTSTERWKRVQGLWDLLELLPASQQEEELARAEPDPTIRREVLDLLQAMRDEETAQEDARRQIAEASGRSSLALPQPGADWDREQPDLKLLALIGSGGSGAVFRAVRKVNGVEQNVAVKIYHAHRSDPADLDRFVREQRMLATLTDPGIVRFFDSGLTPDGRPYLVMELAEGEHITTHCDEHRLGIEARLRLLLSVCRAVASAHARLVVHLDLKPSNILVTPEGDIKLLDFGTARLIDHSRASVVTQQLTPHYASPERLRGEAASVSSDVYSLGLILFELCSGGSPFPRQASILGLAERAGGSTKATGPAEAVSAESAKLRGTSLEKLRGQLRGDLASICAKALAFAPEARYLTVSDLAGDLRRYLAGEPVQAHTAGYGYRASKFVRRYAGRLALASAVAIGLSVAAVYSAMQAQKARVAAERAEAAQIFLTNVLSASGPGNPKTTIVEAIALAESSVAGLSSQDEILASDIELTLAEVRQAEDPRGPESVRRALELARAAGDVSREASALAAQGYQSYLGNRPDEAWEQLTRSLELWKRKPSAFSTVRSVWFLGNVGKYMTYVRPSGTASREPLEQCMTLAARSPQVPQYLRLSCLESLATSLMFGSREYARALPLLVEAVELRRNKPVSPRALSTSLQLLGLNYRFLGKYAEDELAQRESYQLAVEVEGPEALLTANQRSYWAAALAGIGRSQEGLHEAEAALAIYRRTYPQRGVPILSTPLSAAMTNACLSGRYQVCEVYAREALETLGPNPASEDPRLATAQGYLGLALANLGKDNAEAKRLLESAIQKLKATNRHPSHRQGMEAALAKLP